MITVVIFCLLITQSSASFFSDITGALGTVQSKVGKLFTDVGYDLKETVDCATFVVEEAIYDQDEIDHYYDKCKETTTMESASVDPIIDKPATVNIILKPIEPLILSGKVIEITTKPSIIIVEKDSKGIEQKLSNVEAVVNEEFSQVGKATSHLEFEFQGLSKNVDEKLKTIEEEKAEVEQTLLEIKHLQLQEELDIQRDKDEIKRIFEEILNRMNESTQELDLKIEMDNAIKDIEKHSSKAMLEEIERWKNKGVEQLRDTRKEDAVQNPTEPNIPRTFKELAAKISKEMLTNNNMDQETATSSIRTRSLDTTISNHFLETSTSNLYTTTNIEPALAPIEISMAPLEQKVSTIEFSTKAYTYDLIYKTDMSTNPVTVTSISTVTSTPRTVTTLSYTNSVSQSSTVPTTTAQPITNNPVFSNESTLSSSISSLISTSGDVPLSISSTEPTKEESRAANQEKQSTITISTAIVKPESTTSAVTVSPSQSPEFTTESVKTTTTTSIEPVTTITSPSSEFTTTSEVTLESAKTSSVFTPTFQETEKRNFTVASEVSSRSSSTEISTDVSTTSTEAVLQEITLALTTTGVPMTEASPVPSTQLPPQPSIAVIPVTEVITTSFPTVPTTPVPLVMTGQLPPPLSITDKPVTVAATTITTVKAVSSNRISSETSGPENMSPKEKVRKTKKKRRPLAHIKVHQVVDPPPTPDPSSDIDNLIPKDPAAAVAEALKTFGGSIKRKAVLDDFFKNLDAVPSG